MANNGIVVGGGIATAAIIFAVFVSFSSIDDSESNELIVVNENHTQTIGESVGIERSYEYSLIDIFEKSEESVVQVNVLRGGSDGGMGSGFVYSEEGYIITNQHVVRDAKKVTVTFLDGEAYIGDVIGTDPDLDIAVVKVSPSNTYLQPITIGDSSKLKVGEKIAAIGNPFGLSGSMTSGIVSQIGRLLPQESGYSIPDVIQTDAAINPGNSGGPLLNSLGQLIGVNTAIYSPSGASSGIGFAIPVNTVKRIVPELIAYGRVQTPILGITRIPQPDYYRELWGIEGVIVLDVVEGSDPERLGMRGLQRAQRGQIQLGDVIVEISGQAVTDEDDFATIMEQHKPGDVVKVTTLRDNRLLEYDVQLQAPITR